MLQTSARGSAPTLLRSLGLQDATSLVVGCIVGVGIFRTASAIARQVPSPSLILALWVLGGVLSLCGALCYAELAAMFPSSGGDYVYISRIFGRAWGFLFGWTKLFIERTGTIAVLGFVFAEYVSRVTPLGETTLRIVAASGILLLTVVNCVGVRWGTVVQNLFTILKIGALCAVLTAGLIVLGAHRAVPIDWRLPPMSGPLAQSMGVALVFVLWTYGGWTEAAYVAEEVVNPTRNIPQAIIRGVLFTTALYLAVNWSYLVSVPMDQLPSTPLVASTTMQRVLGQAGAVFIACMIACSAFGALNGYILTGARILYAMGQEHPLFARLARVHPIFRTPVLALWTNAMIAIGLVFTKTFDQIMTYSTVVISVFFTLAAIGVMVLRRRDPGRERPYRTVGYPVTPIAFSVVMVGFIVNACIKEPREAAFGFLLLALGVPLYWWSQRGFRHSTGS